MRLRLETGGQAITRTASGRIRALFGVLLLVIFGTLGVGTAPVAATGSLTSALPPMPAPSAPTATWRAWATTQAAFMRAVPVAEMVAEHGCTLLGLTYLPVSAQTSPAARTPLGIETTAIEVTADCPAGHDAVFGWPSEPSGHGAASPIAEPLTGYTPTCGTISGPGSACVGPVYDANTGQYDLISSSYLYQGSSSTTGHVEMSEDAIGTTTCYAGSLLENGSNTTLYNGYEEAIVYSWTFSTVWDTTWWEGGPPWTDCGDVCAAY